MLIDKRSVAKPSIVYEKDMCDDGCGVTGALHDEIWHCRLPSGVGGGAASPFQ